MGNNQADLSLPGGAAIWYWRFHMAGVVRMRYAGRVEAIIYIKNIGKERFGGDFLLLHLLHLLLHHDCLPCYLLSWP